MNGVPGSERNPQAQTEGGRDLVGADSVPARRLVTSYCFPPYSDTASIVAGKRVWQHGEPVDAVFNAMSPLRSQDPSLLKLCGGLVRRAAPVRSKSAFSSWQSITEYRALGTETILRWEQEQGPYASLYSRAQFAASHFLAVEYKMRRPDTRWDAEFSDPLSHDVLGNTRTAPAQEGAVLDEIAQGVRDAGFRPPEGLNTFEWCEVAAFALADSLIFTNEHQRDFMLERCHDPALAERAASVAVVSPHPTLTPEFYELEPTTYELSPDRRHIGYFGNFYANRGVGFVLDALSMLPASRRNLLQLHIFTSKPEELQEQVEKKGLAQVVVVNPFVGYLEFLALSRRMDCLLVNDAVSPGGMTNPFLPSKWSDYRGSGQPVWGVVEEGSSLDRQDLHHRSPIGHLSAAAQVLSLIAAGD